MRTRSGKVLRASRPLQAQGTLTEITPSQTGQGTHIRWIRTQDPPQSPPQPQRRAHSSPPEPTPSTSTTTAPLLLPTLSTPGPHEIGGNDFDLSAYITPEPWKPTSPPRPSPFTRKPPKGLFTRGGANCPSPPGHEAHERLQESLAIGAKADRPRGRPLVGPTGTFIQTGTPFDVNASPKAVRFADGAGGTVYPPLPSIVLGSPYCSQEENTRQELPPLHRSTRSRSPTRRNFK